MRTLDPIFQAAMDSGNFTPVVRAAVLDPDDYTVEEYVNLVYFKIRGLDIEVEFYDPAGGYSDTLSLERGVKVGDTEYTIFSGLYHLNKSYKVTGGAYGLYSCHGSLVDPSSVDIAADGSYETVIAGVLGYGTLLPQYAAAYAWRDYQFLPAGQRFHTANIYQFFTLLKQKYLIFARDAGPNVLEFMSCADVLALAAQYHIVLGNHDTFSVSASYRQFVWKDESKVLHAPGPAGYLIHNLGYLESTDSPPSIPNNNFPVGETVVTIVPNLKMETGDCVIFDLGTPGYAIKSVLDVCEIYESSGRDGTRAPASWRMELRPLRYFSASAAGVTAGIETVSPNFEPLSSSGFVGALDQSVTHVQALADAVDEMMPRGGAEHAFLKTGADPYKPAWEVDPVIMAGDLNFALGGPGLLRTIKNADQINLGASGESLNIQAGQGGPPSEIPGGLGGGVAISAGLGGDLATSGAGIVLSGGDAQNGIGGAVSAAGGGGVNGGGAVVFGGGACGGAGAGGSVEFDSGGSAEGPSGDIYLVIGSAPARGKVIIRGSNGGTYDAALDTSLLEAASRVYKFPDADGTFALLDAENHFLGVISIDSPTFFVDVDNHRVGVGTVAPLAMLQVLNLDDAEIGLLIQGASGQTESMLEIQDSGENTLLKVAADGTLLPLQKATASAPTYVKGAIYFDLTLKKLRIGGVSAWESIHSGVGSAYTQTYATASATHPNATAAALTDNSGGSPDATLEAIGTSYSQSAIRNNFADLAAMLNKDTADILDLKKLVNQIIDDLQALNIFG